MSEKDRQWIAWLIAVALIVVGTLLGVNFPQLPPIPAADVSAQDVTNLTGLEIVAPTTMPTATPAAVFDSLGLSNILEVRDAATPIARWENGGDLSLLAGTLNLSFANLALTDGDTLTPTYTVYALDTTGAVTITLAASADEGQLLILINDDANAVVIADTNLRSSDGAAITLTAANDIAVFVYQDSEWNELLLITNS